MAEQIIVPPYTGTKDRHLDFPDNSYDFSNAEKLGRTFKFKLTSRASVATEIILIPNSQSTEGLIIAEGEIGTTDVDGESMSLKTIAAFLEKIKRSPMDILSVDIKSSSEDQLATSLKIKRFNLWGGDEEKLINIEEFKDTYAQDTKRAIVKFDNVSADGDTEIRVKIPAGAGTSFSFTFGAAVDLGYTLAESRRAAKANIIKK